MSTFQTMVVGTDGSDSSLRAVDRAGELASKLGAKLIVATAYTPTPGETGVGGYRKSGNPETQTILRNAKERAAAAGATKIEERAIVGGPVDALVKLADEVEADLLVVGSVGLNTITGRLLGSVSDRVTRRSKIDVVTVHTTD